MKKSIDKVIEVFEEKTLRSCISVYNCLTRHNFLVDDLIQYFDARSEKAEIETIDGHVEEIKKFQAKWETVAPRCPDCGDVLVIPKKALLVSLVTI